MEDRDSKKFKAKGYPRLMVRLQNRQYIRPEGLSDSRWALDLAILNSLGIPVPKEKEGAGLVKVEDPPKGGVG